MSSEQSLELGQDLEEFTFVKMLGAGGFGITYQAIDRSLQRDVAIKEYFPQQFAQRLGDNTIVSRPGDDNAQTFKWGLDRFLTEARTLAKIDHPNVVKVSRYFERNGTAYLVMAFEEGKDLADWLSERTEVPSEAVIKQMILPLLDGLSVIHAQGLIHRDIKPQNIVVRANGTPVLIDFGSARAVGQEQTSLTTLISPGYSPPEQYSNDPATQGPWTDIYAMAGVMYRMISGSAPVDAMARIGGSQVEAAASVAKAKYSKELLGAIDQGLQLEAGKRPQSIDAFRAKLLGEKPPAIDKSRSEATTLLNPTGSAANQAGSGLFKWIAAGIVVVAGLVGVFVVTSSDNTADESADVAAQGAAIRQPEIAAAVTQKLSGADTSSVTEGYLLRIKLTPPEAQVEVDGEPHDPEKRLAAGSYVVVARQSGYVTHSQEISLQDDLEIEVRLDEVTYPFTVVTQPANAQVRITNLEQPYQPGMALISGQYRVEVSASGHETWSGTLTHGDAPTTEAVTLAKLHALTLNVTPADASVKVIGQRYSPGMRLVAGDYDVEVSKESFETYRQRITLVQDQVIEVALNPLGVLTFILSPADAQIELPDIGRSYRPGMRLPVGPLRVIASKERYQSVDREVLIRPGNNAIVLTLKR